MGSSRMRSKVASSHMRSSLDSSHMRSSLDSWSMRNSLETRMESCLWSSAKGMWSYQHCKFIAFERDEVILYILVNQLLLSFCEALFNT